MLTILSSDPGYTNYGWSIVQFRKSDSGLSFRVVENGLCRSTVSNLKDGKVLSQQLEEYAKFMKSLIEKHNVDAICAERFMTRGINGPSVEMVNFMLGVLVSLAKKPVKLWPAVVWKNALRRKGVELKEWYKYCRTTPHQLDAVLIGVYTGYVAYGYKDFGDLNIKKLMPRLIDQVESTTEEKLFNRKGRA